MIPPYPIVYFADLIANPCSRNFYSGNIPISRYNIEQRWISFVLV